MTGAPAAETAATLADLIARGPAEHAMPVWAPAPGDRPAAVLLPLLGTLDDLRILVTRRSTGLTNHAGEISFPGGRPEPEDHGPEHTALREAHEEVGLPQQAVQIVGQLPPTTTYKTGYAITPFVGLVAVPSAWTAQPSEVAEVVEPRLVDLVQARRIFHYERPDAGSLAMPVFPIDEERQIWGATARILDELLLRLAPIIPGAAEIYAATGAAAPATSA